MSRALLGLGANLGDRADTLARAVASLHVLPRTRVTRVSSLYETAPVGYADQPDFLNLVVEVDTTMSPHALLGACLGIEAALGRRRTFENAPRVVDVDLLCYDNQICQDMDLVLPHPRMGERGFVLEPLSELFPDHIVDAWDFSEDLEKAKSQRVRRCGPLVWEGGTDVAPCKMKTEAVE